MDPDGRGWPADSYTNAGSTDLVINNSTDSLGGGKLYQSVTNRPADRIRPPACRMAAQYYQWVAVVAAVGMAMLASLASADRQLEFDLPANLAGGGGGGGAWCDCPDSTFRVRTRGYACY